MNKISAFGIIKEAFGLFFGNFGYIIKKLWFVFAIFFSASFALTIMGSYDGLLIEYINEIMGLYTLA